MNIAIVTGASSGMGREFVLQVSKKENFDEIWVIARRKERLEELSKEVSTPLRPIALDLTKKESIEELYALLRREHPNVRVLANCSGYGKFGSYNDVTCEDCIGMIDLNCRALTLITNIVLPYMAEGAHIMNLDSLSSFQPVPYLNVYAATKAYVLSYSRALNVELRARKINVLAVCPGFVRTEFFDRAKTANDKAVTNYGTVFEASDVIRKAVKDLYAGKKDVSVYSFKIRAQVFFTKLLPHRLVMKIWLKRQGH